MLCLIFILYTPKPSLSAVSVVHVTDVVNTVWLASIGYSTNTSGACDHYNPMSSTVTYLKILALSWGIP